ncbi:MAG: hypothetical protein DHS20C14_05950 [Phycisphaeraceae bacterium]|nr:MAG: hypothetical protein DHS20C14_05950 [Phycisphaeraceae bacterium]
MGPRRPVPHLKHRTRIRAAILAPLLAASAAGVVCAPALAIDTTPEDLNGLGSSGATDTSIFAGVGRWTHFGGSAARRSRSRILQGGAGIPSLAAPEWIVEEDDQSRPIVFLSPSGVVLDESRAFVVGTIDFQDHAIAVSRYSGDVVWTAPVPNAIFDSWATPAIDWRNRTMLIASSDTLTALDANTGATAWQTELEAFAVNASPAVTTDLGPRDRAFVTDFPTTPGAQGRLYCINVDPFDAAENPHLPGDIVWSVTLGGLTSGNTPAYAEGRVFVSTAGPGAVLRGEIRAFNARATEAPDPEWVFQNTIQTGFFSGVNVIGGSIFASSYSFTGDEFSANTVRVNAADGSLIWSTPSNRTDATPVVIGDVVAVSSGLPNDDLLPSFGSFPTVQAFDLTTGALLWDIATDTWTDLDNDEIRDPGEFLSVGGWTHQPIATNTAGGARLIVGSMPTGTPLVFQPNNRLWVLDLDWNPIADPFPPVVDVYDGAGSTPAFADGWVYTIGPDGLYAFGPEPLGLP